MFGNMSIDEELFKVIRCILPQGKTILELGSGEGTGELAKLYNMISVEQSEEYLGTQKTTYIHAPIVKIKPPSRFPESTEWYTGAILREELPKYQYDLLLVDGPYGDRGGFWKYKDLFKYDVPVIYDDAHRQDVARLTYLTTRMIGESRALFLNMNRSKAFSVILPNEHKSKIYPILELDLS